MDGIFAHCASHAVVMKVLRGKLSESIYHHVALYLIKLNRNEGVGTITKRSTSAPPVDLALK